tara:strand:+ start:321 stop:1202 length:882 start_codon:yes stop_codon:yes gene_type:complete
MELYRFLNNKLNISTNSKYAAIIGKNPSEGARSPSLWNKAYLNYKCQMEMYPFDVDNFEKLENLVHYLDSDNKFIGGSIAVPFKTAIAKILGEKLTKETKKIGAVNCIYRNNEGELIGTNTDGEAAIISLSKINFSFNKKKVLILGNGGVAKAVIAYVHSQIGSEGVIIVTRRTKSLNENNEEGVIYVDWKKYPFKLDKFDLIINCTSIGYGADKDSSPLSNEELYSLKRNILIYDVIYQPNPTKLLKISSELGFKTLSGLDMNLEQAVLAFNYANKFIPNISNSHTRKFMID